MNDMEYPDDKRMLVNSMGSKKKPILPIKRLETVGREILRISLVVERLGFKSFLVRVNFLGRKKIKVMIDANSVAMLKRIKPITALTMLISIKGGMIRNMRARRRSCSMTLEIVLGSIF